MKKGALILLFLGCAVARPLLAQGIISDAEINDKREENLSEVIPHRDLLYNPVGHSEAGAEAREPVLDEQTYFEDNIIESGQIAIDRVYDLIPFPGIVPFNVLNPDKGWLRADNKWDVETRSSVSWEYDDNVNDSPVNRDASQIVSAGAGVMARLGSFRPDPVTGTFSSPYAFMLDYDASYDRYLEKPEYDVLNQEMHLMGRIGRDTLIIVPTLNMGDVTSRPLLDPDRVGLVRQRFIQTGLDVTWRLNDFTYHGVVGNAIVKQPDNGLVDYDSLGTYHELSYTVNTLSRIYVYSSYQNFFPNVGSFAWQCEQGVGYDYVDNQTMLGRFRWKSRLGWNNVEYQNNPFRLRDNSGIRAQSEVGFYLTPKWEWIFHVGRDHQFDTSIADNGYLEDYIGGTLYWRPTAAFGAGVTYFAIKDWDDTNNANPFLQRVVVQANYILSYHTIAFARATYEHSIAGESATPDVVSFRESVGLEFRF